MKRFTVSVVATILTAVLSLAFFTPSVGEGFMEIVTASNVNTKTDIDRNRNQNDGFFDEVADKRYTVSSNFKIEIPTIALSKNIEPNVDPRDKAIYGPVIERAVAHGMFTKLPDETFQEGNGNVYLFAHREGTAPFFERLGELVEGDVIYLYYGDDKYVYEVSDYFIVNPKDTSVYTGSSPSPTLTLQTCNNGVKERLIVRAELVEVK